MRPKSWQALPRTARNSKSWELSSCSSERKETGDERLRSAGTSLEGVKRAGLRVLEVDVAVEELAESCRKQRESIDASAR